MTQESAHGAEKIDRMTIIGRDGRWLASWALRFIVLAIAAYIAFLGLGKVWSGLLPILLAILLCTVLWPPVRWLTEHKFPPALAVLTTLLGVFAAFGAIFSAMGSSVTAQSKELYDKAFAGITQLQQWIQGPPLNIKTDQVNNALDELVDKLKSSSSDLATGVLSGVSTASEVIVTAVIALVLSFFFLKDGPRFLPWVRSTTGSTWGWHLTEVLTRTWNTLAGFIRAQAAVSLVDAIFIGIGLLLMKVPLALVLTVITFFAGFIPIIGAISAGAISVLIALVSNGVTSAIGVLILIVAVQQLESHILSPILQSKAMDLHPVIVLLSVTVGGGLFGIVGAFLAVPVAATIAVWLRYHGDLVSLRAGEKTLEDIELATRNSTKGGTQGLDALRGKLANLSRQDRTTK
ncbi:AI-2E family transporter [Corynebacterium sp. 13CS0277]|uniref:AI-2E family transporter n=1 Tax=Corynebacterium sp. 13CS0277 TaxID=2071994 RepID=UPI000D02CDEE|nr:AI-2E family transporter [Corynebacterium sp. 13CS0277]PRQ11823.1 AI-2E family transporter [Corynebacterium sp. 13CS0277]